MAYRWVEVSVKLLGSDPRENVEVFLQRIPYDSCVRHKTHIVSEIAALVNELPPPVIKREVGVK